MYDRDDGHYDTDLSDAPESNLLGTTVRNVALLLGACLFVAWAMSGLGDFGLGAGQAGPQVRQSDARPGSRAEVADADEPVQRVAQGGSEIIVPPGPRGHFLVTATVNGVDVRFLVDTGASTVTLTEEDAQRVGLSPHSLDFSASYRTANGEIRAAPVTLRQMQIGDLEVSDVEGTVTRAPLHISLLGMTFLSRLAGFEVRGDGLVLRF